MQIQGTRTIAEYKAAQKKLIQAWVDEHFIAGAVTWELSDPLHVTIKDSSGDTMVIHFDQIDGHYIAN